MIPSVHILVGATIGAKTQNLGLIVILGLLSHLILDKIPHWDYGNRAIERFSQTKSYKNLFILFLKIIVDGIMGLIIVFLVLWQKNIFRHPIDFSYLLFILIGIFISLLPDFILLIIKLFYNKRKLSQIYVDLHDTILHSKHIRKPTALGLGTEILVSLIAILILLF